MSDRSNILYINIYNYISDNINYSLSLSDQINKQNIQSECINLYVHKSQLDISGIITQYSSYAKLYNSRSVFTNIVEYTVYSKLFQLYSNYHAYIFLFNKEIIIPNNFSNIINETTKQYPLVGIYNNDEIYGAAFNKEFIFEIIRKNLYIDNISSFIFDNTKNIENKINIPIMNLGNPINNDIVLAENEYFVFFDTKNKNIYNLTQSYVYANKRNNKAYNINNNLIGDIVFYDEKQIDIKWSNIDNIVSYSLK